MKRVSFLLFGVVALSLIFTQDYLAQAPKVGRLTKEEQAALLPGLSLQFLSLSDPKQVVDARRVRLAALHVPEGTAATTFLPPGPFLSQLSGYLKVPEKGTYTFRVLGSGKVEWKINGNEFLTVDVLDKGGQASIELVKGYHRLEIRYASSEKGDAKLRVLWSGETFAEEPLPPDLLFTRGDEATLQQGLQVREGRQLFANLGCARCHTPGDKISADTYMMPEMKALAPHLIGAGDRFSAEWIARWIQNPHELRPQATMPRLLQGTPEQIGEQARDIAAYLLTLSEKKTAAAPDAELASAGAKHFETLGCIGCHNLKEPKSEDQFGRLSLYYVAAKFTDGSLISYLQMPQRHHEWTRMPDFKLTATEATALAAFLKKEAKGKLKGKDDAAKAGDAVKGAKLFTDVGCVQCHQVEASKPVAAPLQKPIATEKLNQGCLAEAPEKVVYALTESQKGALRKFLATDRTSLQRETAAEFSLRQMESLQCVSCHRRDGGISKLYQVLEEEGSSGTPPQPLPLLTWVGEKIKPEWTAKMLSGAHDQTARPWLKARMPAFPARAELLALGLSHEHGFAKEEDVRPKHDPKLAEIGLKLLPQQGGFGCIVCHAVGKQPAVSPFEAPGINLLDASLRLRYSYFPRWMVDPTRVDPAIKMPRFAPDGKTTPIKEHFQGDAAKQFNAIWHTIQSLQEKSSP